MFKIKHIETTDKEGKNVYVSHIPDKLLNFTNKYHLLEFHKDLNNLFLEYYFTLEVFYTRVKMLDLQLSKNGHFGVTTSRLFLELEESRLVIFDKRQKENYPWQIAGFISYFNGRMMYLCFEAKKHHYQEAENIFHLLSDLKTKFYKVLDNSYQLHKEKSLKLFI